MTLATVLLMAGTLLNSGTPLQPLDGEWSFTKDSAKAGVEAGWFQNWFDRTTWQHVSVPAFWETYPGVGAYDGWGWYTRTFTLDSADEPMALHFKGVDDDATVWVNGAELFTHSGYAEPFAVDISRVQRKGENRVVILVKDYGGGGGIYKPVTLCSVRALDDLLKGPYYGKPARPSAPWVRDATIYSVYLRSFSQEGTFAGLEKRIPELKRTGVTVLWLMPIHPVGAKNRKGTLGSPYSVRDYYGVNPEFGTMADFKRLLGVVHKNGLKLIIDMVANHTAWDNPMIAEHPEWFTHDSSGAIVPPNPDWTDVADLDYSKPGLRKYMEDMMVWWVKDVGIDGFRCDVAEMVPTDFWESVRDRLDKVKSVMMLAEGSIPEHHLKAFDLSYSWNLYDQLGSILSGKSPASLVDSLLKTESFQYPTGSLRLRFTTNHDKNAWDAPAVEKFGVMPLKAATVLVNTIPGVPLLYTGEEVMNDKRLSLFEKVPVDWSRSRDLGTLNAALFHLREAHPALSAGGMVKLHSNCDADVLAFLRTSGKDSVLTIINLHATVAEATINVPPAMREAVNGMKGLFGGKTLAVDRDGKLTIRLNGYGYDIAVR
jgi:glycosidase